MVKGSTKPRQKQNNTINSILPENNNTSPKSKQQIDKEYYQKNKERKKTQQKLNYTKKKEQQKAQSTKYYQATNIKILLTLKEYTELNQQKRKLWLDFTTTLYQLSQGINTIEEIMRLRELADNLIRDCRETAQSKVKKGKSWNSLDYDEQQRLIKYWGYEKARIENGYIDEAERLEKQSENYLKDLESAKFHEERGKIKCECWQCQERKLIQEEVKAKLKKEMDGYGQRNKATDKEQCPECKRMVKELDEESGVCKGCKRKYE